MIENKYISIYGPRLKSYFGKNTVGGGTVLFENLIQVVEGK